MTLLLETHLLSSRFFAVVSKTAFEASMSTSLERASIQILINSVFNQFLHIGLLLFPVLVISCQKLSVILIELAFTSNMQMQVVPYFFYDHSIKVFPLMSEPSHIGNTGETAVS